MNTNKSETIGKIAVDLLKAQAEMGDATKAANNPFFKSKYADLNAIREACIPVLNKFNITVLQPNAVVEGKQYIETLLLHSSGEYLTSLTEVISGKGTAQDAGSGISYARRYGLQSFLNIGAVDDDGEGAMNRNAKPAYNQSKVPDASTNTGTASGGTNSSTALVSTQSLPIGSVQSTVEPLKKVSFSRKNKKTEVAVVTSPVFTAEELATSPTDENW